MAAWLVFRGDCCLHALIEVLIEVLIEAWWTYAR
jgi:hypothetical protein